MTNQKTQHAGRAPLEFMVGRHYIQHIKGKEDRDVVLMAISGIHAMVRRKGYLPYICSVSDLSLIPTVAEMRKLLSPDV